MSVTYCINLQVIICRFVVLESIPPTSSVYIVILIMLFWFVSHGLMIEMKFELKILNFFFLMDITEDSVYILYIST